MSDGRPGQDALRTLRPWRRGSALTHVVAATTVGLAVGLVVGILHSGKLGGLVGWITAAVIFLTWTWTSLWPMGAEHTRAVARREDPSRPIRDLLLLAVAVGSILAVAFVIVPAGSDEWLAVSLGVVCIVVSWMVVHTVFMLAYARLYYAEPVGGLAFNEDDPPCYRDFAYVAFTVGMTFQVSDTAVQKTAIRMTVLRQALISFFFGAIIIAVTINIIAALGRAS